MKTKTLLQNLFLPLALLMAQLPAYGQGGSNAGNGGDVIDRGGYYQLLDLVEAGVGTKAELWVARAIRDFHPGRLAVENRYLTHYLGDSTRRWAGEPDLFVKRPKLREALIATLSRMNGLEGAMILGGIWSFAWKLTDEPLVNIGDERALIDTKANPLIQVAVRRNRSIVIHEPTFDKMGIANQVALLLHEVFYAYLKPRRLGDEIVQVSWDAREIVGDFFKSLDPEGGVDFDLKHYNTGDGNVLSFASLVELSDFIRSPVRLSTFSSPTETGMVLDFGPKLHFSVWSPKSQDNLLPRYASAPIELWHFSRDPQYSAEGIARDRCGIFQQLGFREVSLLIGTTTCKIRFAPLDPRNSEYKMLTLGERYRTGMPDGTRQPVDREGCLDGFLGLGLDAIKFKTAEECTDQLTQAIYNSYDQVLQQYKFK